VENQAKKAILVKELALNNRSTQRDLSVRVLADKIAQPKLAAG
jgi:hypothetical protein